MSAAALPTWWPKSGLAWLLVMLALVAAPMVVQAWRYRYPAADYLRIPFQAAAGLVVAVLAFTVVLMPLEGALLGEAVAKRWQGLHLALLPAAGYLSWRWWSRKRPPTEWIKRGAVVADGTPYAEQTAAAKRKRAQDGRVLLSLAGVWVPPADEVKHFKLIGSTGTGKSTAIAEIMRGALGRGDRAVFADPDGGYLARFYEPARGDVILNPFEARSVRWDLFGEIGARYDADQLARSLVVGEDSWSGYARTFLAALIWRCHQDGHRDVAELWRLAAVAASDELREIVVGTPAQPFLEPDNARMFGSIRSVTVAAIAGLQYVAEQPATAEAFSVRRWVREGRGVLFLPYQAEQIAALRSVIATWVRLAIFQTMGLGEVVPGQAGERRLWFVVDELDALGRIDGLKDALARLRKFGGRCVLGFQSIAQVSSTYGQGEARTIVENCGNTLILRCSASEGGGTAQFASMLIGQRELVREHVSVTHSREGWLGSERSISHSEQHVTEAAVLASEIEALPDRVGFLKFTSQPTWLAVAIRGPIGNR